MKKKLLKEGQTDYEKALCMLINFIPIVQLTHNIRVYQLYEMLKDAKTFIKFDKHFKERLLYNEKVILEYEQKLLNPLNPKQ